MTSVRLRIQHAPGRTQPLNRLLNSLQHPAVIVTDHGDGVPNPWRGYKACLSKLSDAFTHVCVLQDDTVACQHLPEALHLIAEANPDRVVCLFLGGQPKRTAAKAREAIIKRRVYVDVHGSDFVPVVATMWPNHLATSFLEWANENPLKLGHRDPRSDDAVAGRWMRYTRHPVVCTVPSLVQHPDDVPSTIGKRAAAGGDRNRVALHWIGDNDPLEINWAQR